MSADLHVHEGWRRASRPVMSVLLGACWLLLQQSVDVGNLITAVVLGWGLPKLIGGFMGPASRPKAWARALHLVGMVLKDIVMSNIAVARLVLNPRSQPSPGWVQVPMTVQEPLSRALLASIITMTPGTLSAVVDEEARCIWVHALDCQDPAGIAADIDQRYQQPLKEILE